MLLRLLFPLFILFSTAIQANDFPIEIIEYLDNTKIVVFIDKSELDTSSKWSPFKESMPLTMVDTLKYIQKYTASNPELLNASLTSIELKQIPHHEKYWHYLVKMKSRTNGHTQRHYFIVLMNGKVIAGLREPQMLK